MASLRLSAFILLGQLPSITAQLYNVNSYIIKTSGSCEYHVPSSAECNAAYAALINPGFTSGVTAYYSCPYCSSLTCPRHASAVGCSVRNSASYPVYANYACTGGNAPCSANVRCLCYAPWPSPAPPIPPPSMPSHPPTPPALPAPPSPPPTLSAALHENTTLSEAPVSGVRRLAVVSCPRGYFDQTNGDAKNWGCGCDNSAAPFGTKGNCAGGCYTNGRCGCACSPVLTPPRTPPRTPPHDKHGWWAPWRMRLL